VQRILSPKLRETAEVAVGRQQFFNAVTKAKRSYSRIVNRATLNSGFGDENCERLEETLALV